MPGQPIFAFCWVEREDYPRFVAVSADRMPATYDDWLRRVEPRVEQLKATGSEPIKVSVDPDAMAAWCRGNGRKVDTNGRAAYAAMLALRRHDG